MRFYIGRWTAKTKLLLFCAWGMCIFVVGLIPSPPKVEYVILGWDKFQHAVAFALLALLAGWTLEHFQEHPLRRWLFAFTIAVLFGALLEAMQGLLTKTRTADPADLFADAIGAISVSMMVIIIDKH